MYKYMVGSTAFNNLMSAQKYCKGKGYSFKSIVKVPIKLWFYRRNKIKNKFIMENKQCVWYTNYEGCDVWWRLIL